MSATTSGRATKFFDAAIGKKIVMAVTGLILVCSSSSAMRSAT